MRYLAYDDVHSLSFLRISEMHDLSPTLASPEHHKRRGQNATNADIARISHSIFILALVKLFTRPTI